MTEREEVVSVGSSRSLTDLHGVVTQRGNEDVALALPQTIQQGAERGQLSHLHTKHINIETSYIKVVVCIRACAYPFVGHINKNISLLFLPL